jgi:hypothetical protein
MGLHLLTVPKLFWLFNMYQAVISSLPALTATAIIVGDGTGAHAKAPHVRVNILG